MIKTLKLLRNAAFAINLASCVLLLIAAIRFQRVLSAPLFEGLGLNVHVTLMLTIFVSAFSVAVFHQLYSQAVIEKMRNRR
jgi:hypothetical protein